LLSSKLVAVLIVFVGPVPFAGIGYPAQMDRVPLPVEDSTGAQQPVGSHDSILSLIVTKEPGRLVIAGSSFFSADARCTLAGQEEAQMTQRIVREIDRYDCEDDDSNDYVVIVLQHYVVWQPLSGEREEKPTTKELRLSDGRHVNWLDDETFQIVENDKILRKF
jgi:hypothetical protein